MKMNRECKIYAKAALNLVITFLVTWLCIKFLPPMLTFFMPLIIGGIIAWIAGPVVRFLEIRLKIRRKAGTAFVIIAVISAILALAYFIGNLLFRQINGLLSELPYILEDMLKSMQKLVSVLHGSFLTDIESYMRELAGKITAPSLDGLKDFAKRLPDVFFSIVMSVLFAYFFTAGRKEIQNFWEDYLPKGLLKYRNMIKESMSKAVGGYFKAQLKIEIWIYLILALGLWVIGIKYAPLVAVLIAAVDFLPVFGAGTVLLPWGILRALDEDWRRVIGLLVIWMITIVVRQVIQPYIVGDTVGLSPIPTLFFLFVGYRFFGVPGMIVAVPFGIIVLNMYGSGVFDTIINSGKILCEGINRLCRLTPDDYSFFYRKKDTDRSEKGESDEDNSR